MFITLFFACILSILITFAYANNQGAPWVPMRKDDLRRFLRLAGPLPNKKLYDLGCGDGRLIVTAARAGAQAVGYEISLLPWLLANLRLACSASRARIKFQNFWSVGLNDADIVYFFLMPKIFPRLISKLKRELPDGAMVISYVWPLSGWRPIVIDRFPNRPNLYLYRK